MSRCHASLTPDPTLDHRETSQGTRGVPPLTLMWPEGLVLERKQGHLRGARGNAPVSFKKQPHMSWSFSFDE